MIAKLPNLELLEYKAKNYFFANASNIILIEEKVLGGTHINLTVEVFPQTWGNTCLGFDTDGEGNAYFGGDMLTEAYTTVFFEPITETYLVFFGDEICYQVQNANKCFLEDLKNHSLKSLSKAMKNY